MCIAEAAQKRLFCQGVHFNSKERSFVQLAIKIDGKYCCCMKNTSGGRCTMTNSSSSGGINNSSNSGIYTHTAAYSHTWYLVRIYSTEIRILVSYTRTLLPVLYSYDTNSNNQKQYHTAVQRTYHRSHDTGTYCWMYCCGTGTWYVCMYVHHQQVVYKNPVSST